MQLFIVGGAPRSALAVQNLEAICGHFLAGRYSLTVIDVVHHPERAVNEGLLGLPCLIKTRPGLVRRLVGDLSDQGRVLQALGLHAA